MYCINCGAKNDDNSKFCMDCGTPLFDVNEPANETDAEPVVVAEPIVEDIPVVAEDSVIEDTPIVVAEPAIEDVPAVVAEPTVEDIPAVVEEPAIEDVPVVVAEPTVEDIPVVAEGPVIEDTPIVVAEPEAPVVPDWNGFDDASGGFVSEEPIVPDNSWMPDIQPVAAFDTAFDIVVAPAAEAFPEPEAEYAVADEPVSYGPMATPAFVMNDPIDLSPKSVGEIRNDYLETDDKKKKKKSRTTEREKGDIKKWLIPLVIAVAGVAVIAGVIIAGILTSWFGLFSGGPSREPAVEGPIGKLIVAFDDILYADSITVSTSHDIDDETVNSSTVRAVIDSEKEEITAVISSGEIVSLYEKNKLYTYNGYRSFVRDLDLTAESKVLFDIRGENEVSWNDVAEKLNIGDYVKTKKIDDIVALLVEKYLCDEEWLEDTLGFDKSIDEYVFEFEYGALLAELADIADEADALICKKSEAISAIEENIESVDVVVSVKLESGKATSVEITVATEESTASLSIAFSGINDTEIKEAECESVKADVEKAMEDFAKQSCAWCGSKDNLTFENDMFGCYECMELVSVDKCELCSEKKALKPCRGYDLCLECYPVVDEADIPDDAKCSWCESVNELSDVDGDGEYLCSECKADITTGKCALCKTKTELNTLGKKKYCHSCYGAVKSGDYKNGLYGECAVCKTYGDVTEYEESGKSLCADCIAKYKLCAKCDEFYEGEFCPDCKCDICNNSGVLSEYSGSYLCPSCNDSSSVCSKCDGVYVGDHCPECYSDPCAWCGQYVELTSYGPHYVCWDCYRDCHLCYDCDTLYTSEYCPTCYNTPCELCGTKAPLNDYGGHMVCNDCYWDNNLCYTCNTLYTGDYCPVCYNTPCELCGTKGYLNDYGGHMICDDCYWDNSLCDNCNGLFSGDYCPNCPCQWCGGYTNSYDMTHYGDYYLCWDCYWECSLCYECNTLYSDSYCPTCYNTPCELCGTKDYLNDYGGHMICDDCYWSHSLCYNCNGLYTDYCHTCYDGTCSACGAYGYVYDESGYDLCESCYYVYWVCAGCGALINYEDYYYSCPHCGY